MNEHCPTDGNNGGNSSLSMAIVVVGTHTSKSNMLMKRLQLGLKFLTGDNFDKTIGVMLNFELVHFNTQMKYMLTDFFHSFVKMWYMSKRWDELIAVLDDCVGLSFCIWLRSSFTSLLIGSATAIS